MRAAAYTEVDVRGRDAEIVEEDIREHRVIVLAGMDNNMLGARCPRRRCYGGEFDKLGPRADDTHDLHGDRV